MFRRKRSRRELTPAEKAKRTKRRNALKRGAIRHGARVVGTGIGVYYLTHPRGRLDINLDARGGGDGWSFGPPSPKPPKPPKPKPLGVRTSLRHQYAIRRMRARYRKTGGNGR